MDTVKLDRLLNQLNISPVAAKDKQLYQVISQLIQTIKQMGNDLEGDINSVSSVVNNVTNNQNNGLTIPLLGSAEWIDSYTDNPYPSLQAGVSSTIINNTNNNIVNQSLLSTGIESYSLEGYADDPFPSLGERLVQNITNTTITNISNNSLLSTGIEGYSLEGYADDPYPVMGIGGVINNVTNNTSNIINNLLLNTGIEAYGLETYADDPFPALGTALPIPVATAGNPTITDDTTTNAVMYPVWVTANSGALPLKVSSSKLSWNPSNGTFGINGAVSSGNYPLKITVSAGGQGFEVAGTGGTLQFNQGGVVSTMQIASSTVPFNIGTAAGSTIAGSTINFITTGNIVTTILNTGNVGIGTTSPQNKFVVSNAGAAGIEFAPSVGGIVTYNRSTLAYAPLILSASTIDFNIAAGASAMTINALSNVGINVTAPLTKLHVSGPSSASPGATGPASGGIFTVFASDTTESLAFGALTSSPFSSWIQTHDPASGYYPLALNPLGGNVGIGTTSPQQPFVISNAGAQGIEFIPSTGFIFTFNRSTVAYAPMGLNASSIIFQISGVTKATIDTSGNVGIGVTSPTAVLHLKAGTATANTAPLKFNAGTLLSTPEIGTLEFTDDGTTAHIYGTVRIASVVTRVQIV